MAASGLPTSSRNAVPTSTRSEIDSFLGEARAVAPALAGTARLVFALDATASRQPTWDLASGIQAGMFETAAAVGGLAVQLVYFRGFRECRASRWVADPRQLCGLMGQIRCQAGQTQIGRVLAHVGEEAGRGALRGFIYVGDAVEEGMDGLCAAAGELGLLGVKGFFFHEGQDPTTGSAMAELARLTGGVSLAFDARSPASLEALLRAVAAYAAGGSAALDRLASREAGARRLVAALRPAGP